MAQGGDAISQRIALEGAQEILAQLAQLGTAGETALGKLHEAAGKTSEGVEGFSNALESLGEKFELPLGSVGKFAEALFKLGSEHPIAAFAAIGAAVAGVSAAFSALGEHAARATLEIENQARTLGITGEQFEGLKFAAGQMGVPLENAGRIFDRFNANIGQARNAQEALALATGGATDAQFKQNEALTKSLELLNVARRAQERSQGIETVITGLPTIMEFDKTTTALHEAQRAYYKEFGKARDAFAASGRDIGPVKTLVEQVAEMGGTNVVQTLGQFADRFNAITDPTRRAAEGVKAFGKSWGEVAPLLALGSDGILKLGEEFKRLEVSSTEAENLMAAEFIAGFAKMTTVIEGLSTAIGNIIGQAFVPGFVQMAELLSRNQENIRHFADETQKVFVAAFKAVGDAVRGFVMALNDIAAVINRVLGTEFSTQMLVIIGLLAAFARPLLIISAAFWAIDEAIKAALGPDSAISPQQIEGYVAAFAGLTLGVNSLISAFGALSLVAAPWLVIVGALAVAALAVITNWGPIKDYFLSFWNLLKALGTWIAGVYIGLLVGAWDLIASGWGAVVDLIGGGVDRVIAGFQWIIDTAAAAAAAVASVFGGGGGEAAPAAGFAGGGQVRGPGTGTSDSIWARLSNGEYIINAAAVQRVGVDFLNSINRGMASRLSNIAATPHFASGGLVATTAAGGGGRVAIDLTLNGQSFPDLLAPAGVARSLVSYARGEKVRSAGRKPSWAT